MSADETRDMARAALEAGSIKADREIGGMSGLLLVELLKSGEVPELRLLEAMVNAFYRPDSPSAQRAEVKFRELLSGR